MSAVLSSLDDPGYSPDRQIAQLRVPPHSIEGESSVLGGLLLDNSAWDRMARQTGEINKSEFALTDILSRLASVMPRAPTRLIASRDS